MTNRHPATNHRWRISPAPRLAVCPATARRMSTAVSQKDKNTLARRNPHAEGRHVPHDEDMPTTQTSEDLTGHGATAADPCWNVLGGPAPPIAPPTLADGGHTAGVCCGCVKEMDAAWVVPLILSFPTSCFLLLVWPVSGPCHKTPPGAVPSTMAHGTPQIRTEHCAGRACNRLRTAFACVLKREVFSDTPRTND